MCSQSDLLRFLQGLLSVGRYAQLRLSPMKDVVKPAEVQAASESATVKDAIEALAFSGHSSLAVIHSASGSLIAGVSAAALGSVTDMDQLEDTLMDFLRKNAPTNLCPITSHATGHWGAAIDQMTSRRAHRAWVVDAQCRPLAVLSLTDICSVLGVGRHISSLQANGGVQLRSLWVTSPSSSGTPEVDGDMASQRM